MTNAEPRFVDTNISVYANQSGSARKDGGQSGAFVDQRPDYAGIPCRGDKAPRAVPRPLDGIRVGAGALLLATFLDRGRWAGKQVHDANILATMLANGVTHLLTNNVADFRRFGSLITIEAPRIKKGRPNGQPFPNNSHA